MGLTAAQWGHGRRRRRCRLRVSWCGSWAHHNISCGSRGETVGMRQRRFKVESKLVAAWLLELGLGGNPTLERLRRTKVRMEKEQKYIQAKSH